MSVQFPVLERLKVGSLDTDFQEVSWRIDASPIDILDFTFQIFRSESPEGPFEAVSEKFEDRYVFVDGLALGTHRYRTLFYKVRVEHKASGAYKDTEPFTSEPAADLITLEIRRQVLLRMREFSGNRVWVLPRRTFGMRCRCWDATLGKQLRSGCPTCFDTTYIRGFLDPIETWMQILPSPKAESSGEGGGQQTADTQARLPHYPPCKPGDLVVEGDNRRWRITMVYSPEKNRAAVHQILTLHLIPVRDIEYQVPIKLDRALRDLFLSPERNFSNPQHPSALTEEEVSSIFQLYAHR